MPRWLYFVCDLVAISLLAFVIYFPRYRRRDLLVAYISGIMTLDPGDLILTGTPFNVGPMKAGDQIEVSVSGIGTLANSVA